MMAGFDKYNTAAGGDRELGRYLWLGAIETLINAFIDLDAATRAKLAKNEAKYPVARFRGSRRKYDAPE